MLYKCNCTQSETNPVRQRFSNFFSSGDHFYWPECSTDHPTLVPFESKFIILLNDKFVWSERRLYVISKLCLRFSTIVCDTQFTLFYFFCLFWTNVQSKRTTRAEPEDHSLRNIAVRHFPDEWRELGRGGGAVSLEHFYIVESYISLSLSMEQSPSWDTNMFLAIQEIPHISCNPKYLLLQSRVLPPVSILRSYI
jgi:hypothetical protein